MYTELLTNSRPMTCRRLDTDPENPCDLLRAIAVCDQSQHFSLTGGQASHMNSEIVVSCIEESGALESQLLEQISVKLPYYRIPPIVSDNAACGEAASSGAIQTSLAQMLMRNCWASPSKAE